MNKSSLSLSVLLAVSLAAGCATTQPNHPVVEQVRVVAESPRQWTGVAVLPDGRMFVNYPRWSDDVPVSLAEVKGSERNEKSLSPSEVLRDVTPYPSEAINQYTPGADPARTFVCVQSVVAGPGGKLFVLDPASPKFQGVIKGGPKLLVIDPATKKIVRAYRFDESIAPAKSYLNDIRFDRSGKWAFMTDSGAGALVVLDLESGNARRVLADHPSTKAEETEIIIDGAPVRMGGNKPVVHADGIAVDPNGRWVYWQALTGRTLYRLPISKLIDAKLPAAELANSVERVAEVGPSDGLEAGPDGAIYLTSLEHNAIRRWREGKGIEVVAQGPEFRWPDSLAWGKDGSLYVNCSQIHLGANPTTPYVIMKIPAWVIAPTASDKYRFGGSTTSLGSSPSPATETPTTRPSN